MGEKVGLDTNHNKRLVQQMERALAHAQALVISTLIDTCTVYPDVGDNFVVDIDGIASYDAKVARVYAGSNVIPCRADAVRAFRPDTISGQPTQVDEIDLHLPMDMLVGETDTVVLNGLTYKIRQLINSSDMATTQVAKIMRLGVSLD